MAELDRAKIIDANFSRFVEAQHFSRAQSQASPKEVGLDRVAFIELFQSQMLSRHLDLMARLLKEKNLGFYTIGSSGHEGNAAVARVFRHTDMAFLHYRSGAFMLERARKQASADGVYDHLLSLPASQDNNHSQK